MPTAPQPVLTLLALLAPSVLFRVAPELADPAMRKGAQMWPSWLIVVM